MRLMEWAELADKGRECWKRLKMWIKGAEK